MRSCVPQKAKTKNKKQKKTHLYEEFRRIR